MKNKQSLKLICSSCGIKKVFNNEKIAFDLGWDFEPYFSIGKLVTCPNCPTSLLLFKNENKN